MGSTRWKPDYYQQLQPAEIYTQGHGISCIVERENIHPGTWHSM
jgi:hypothetical protein